MGPRYRKNTTMNQTNQITISHPINYTKNNNTMETNQFFSTDRFKHLLAREFAINKKTAFLGLMALMLIMLLNMLVWARNRELGFHEFGYGFFLITSGCILASLSFTEMDKAYGKQFYLLLPASHFEKFLSKWLITAICYFVVFTLSYFVFSFIGKLLGQTFFDFDIGQPNIFTEQNILFIQVFFALQTMYLLGAVYFRKHAIFKTMLSSFLVTIGSILIGGLIFRIVMFDLFDGMYQFSPTMEINGKMTPVQPSGDFQKFMRLNGENIVRFWGLYIIPAVLLVVGYFKLKETEL